MDKEQTLSEKLQDELEPIPDIIEKKDKPEPKPDDETDDDKVAERGYD